MAIRLLPFRQYAEQDVINMYALAKADLGGSNFETLKVTDTGNADAGVAVKVNKGDMTDGPTAYGADFIDYLGVNAQNLPYVGRDGYPQVTLEATASTAPADDTLGLTLYQTAAIDENGQKLLYYPQKALETQSVLPGQAVPVLTRGVVTLHADGKVGGVAQGNHGIPGVNLNPVDGHAATDTNYADMVGSGIKVSAASVNNKSNLEACLPTAVGSFGSIIAVGTRSAPTGAANIGTNPDLYAGGGGGTASTGIYAVVKFDTSTRIVK